MPIVRKKLIPAEVYPENIRYDADTDTVQSFVNGEWIDNPEADPRTQTTFPPRVTSDPACDAAQSVVDAFKVKIDDILTAIDGAATVFTIAGIILSIFTFGVFAVFITLALGIGDQMLDAGTTALSAALTDPVYHTLVCILRCHMTPSGRLKPGQLGIVTSQVDDQIGGLGATILNGMLNLAGEGGINNLAALGSSAGDCSDCGCAEPCATAVDNGFEYGTIVSVDIDSDTGVTTINGEATEAVPGIWAVRWGFLGDSIPDGCHFGAFTTIGGTDSYYYRIVGEADGSFHGSVSYATLISDAGPECLNMLQTNSPTPFTFTLNFYAC